MNKKRILIVDDDAAIADLLAQALAEEGYETYKESQSLRMYDSVREHRPDLILLDLMMPYLEGKDELELLKLGDERIPVIVVTAKTDAKQEEEEYKKLGVITIVTKPFDLNQLVRLVKRTLGA